MAIGYVNSSNESRVYCCIYYEPHGCGVWPWRCETTLMNMRIATIGRFGCQSASLLHINTDYNYNVERSAGECSMSG